MANKNVKAPAWLVEKDDAKLFKQLLSLDEGEVLKKSDTLLIALLLDAVLDFRMAQENIAVNGMIVTMRGDRQFTKEAVNPAILIKKDARNTIISICKEIGFTPKARSQMLLTEAEIAAEASPFELALKARQEKRK